MKFLFKKSERKIIFIAYLYYRLKGSKFICVNRVVCGLVRGENCHDLTRVDSFARNCLLPERYHVWNSFFVFTMCLRSNYLCPIGPGYFSILRILFVFMTSFLCDDHCNYVKSLLLIALKRHDSYVPSLSRTHLQSA